MNSPPASHTTAKKSKRRRPPPPPPLIIPERSAAEEEALIRSLPAQRPYTATALLSATPSAPIGKRKTLSNAIASVTAVAVFPIFLFALFSITNPWEPPDYVTKNVSGRHGASAVAQTNNRSNTSSSDGLHSSPPTTKLVLSSPSSPSTIGDDEPLTLLRINPPRPFAHNFLFPESQPPPAQASILSPLMAAEAAADSLTATTDFAERFEAAKAAALADRGLAEREVGFKCPPFRYPKGRSADSLAAKEAMGKYSRYTKDFCNASGVLQMQVPLDMYVNKVLRRIAAAVGPLKHGDRVLDFGSGCGTMLNYFALRFGTVGLGIDVTDDAVRFSMAHRQQNNLFCLLNAETQLRVKEISGGNNIVGERTRSFTASSFAFANSNDTTGISVSAAESPLPSISSDFLPNTFDAVVSWGVLHHIRRTSAQCQIVASIVRLLKPGGKAFIGHLRHDKGDYWRRGRCVVEGATIKRIKDGSYFKVAHWAKYGFGSVYVHKLPLSNITAATSPATLFSIHP